MILQLERYTLLRVAIYLIGEGLTIFFAAFFLKALKDASFAHLVSTSSIYTNVILFTLFCQVCIHVCGLYDPSLVFDLIAQLIGLAQAIALAFFILAVMKLLTDKILEFQEIFLGYGALVAAAMAWRIAIRKIFCCNFLRPRVIFLGSQRSVQRVQQNIAPQGLNTNMMPLGNCFKIVAAADLQNAGSRMSTDGQAMDTGCNIEEKQVPGSNADPSTLHHAGKPVHRGENQKLPFLVLDNLNQVTDLSRQYRTRQLLVSKRFSNCLTVAQVYDLKRQGFCLCCEDAMLEAVTGRCDPADVNARDVIFSWSFQGSIRRIFKRLGDIILAMLLTAALLPVLCVFAFILGVKMKGRVFETQPCIGLHRKIFTRYLFYGHPQETVKRPFLRRLCALPQLLNILKGDMSLVGPMPIRPQQAENICHELPIFDERFTVRPGLTGWARVNCTCNGSDEQVRNLFAYELFYLKHMSLFLDIMVLSRAMQFRKLGDKLVNNAA